ncbi:hypothetical protein F2P56_030896 [Juglans regia]|uniref:Receptor-like protein EIX2 n=2 Tax=Juglans regia TaxID=51240 RepID=A0A833TM03_JUGRE|nr:receptor-like protein EIX2 isoform X1 [Juglans regia]KAF5450561.1 hypothetical protein F2P56_030896 [Juglans regia]
MVNLSQVVNWPNKVLMLPSLIHLSLSDCRLISTTTSQLLSMINANSSSQLIFLDLSWNYDLMETHNLDWLTHFSSLQYLDLSRVNLSQVVNWPNKVLMLPSLIHLSLSDCSLISTTTPQFLSINANSSSQLLFLDLSENYDLMEPHNLDWLTHFSSLQYLDLNGVNLSQVVNWPNKVLMLPSLIHLSLSDCSLISTTTPQLLSINANSSSQLLFLDLSYNHDLREPHNLDWLTHFSSLQYLDLNGVNLSQVVNWPNKVLMLPSLIHLSLSDCSLISTTTPQLLSINANSSSQLLFLDLSYNYLTNSVFHWLFNATISSLRTLNLAENQLVGGIPKYFWNLCALEYLTLSYNNLNGSLYEFMSNESSCLVDSLQDFHISNNRFIGSLPESIGNLSNLQTLDVAQNSLTGVITEAHFSNLTKLKMLYLYSNSLILRFSYNWVPPFQLYSIYLSSCKLGSAFPKWLQSQKNYYQLYISDAGISDIIPAWFWNFPPRLTYLDMSNNQLHGNLPDLSSSRLDDFASIDLSANRFDGSIPLFPLNMASLDLSNNRFSGPVSFLCKLNTPMLLESLNLSNNTLSGELPDCWTYIRDLIVLNLANNNFYGKIPDSISSLESLQFLHLSNNGFVGNMPMSLQNCSELITIDLGANNLFGMVPPWIGNNLPNLVILNLRSNQLYGRLPLSLCRLSHIQILDLSLNKIEGTIPECIYNLTAMSHTMDTISSAIYADNISRGSYTDYASLVWKGRELVFKNSLRLVKMIDLSNNKLYGEIPEGITNLIELVALNLSRNNLSGLITPKIGLLRNLQSLDLSGNQLYGEIPMSISNLNFLSQLDLSANNLSGKIPTGTQIQSLDASAFLGNPKLCGSPLPNKCPEDLHPNYINTQGHKKENDDDGFITKGFYVAATLGFIVGFWGVCCISVLNIRYIMKRLISNVRMILA